MPYGQTPAPSDGNTAYMCMGGAGAPGQQLTVWVTHDQAAHWTRTQDLPASGHTAGSTTQCLLAVDATDALRVAVTVYWQDGRQGPTPQETSSFITTDGGVTWQALPGPQSFTIAAMATYQGVTYAIRTTISDVTSRAVDYLWASSDGLRTWRPVDQVLAAADQQVRSFWINQGSGEILAAATSTNPTNPSDTASLWDTHDGGRTWKQLPGASLAMGTILAQTASAAGQPWHICDLYEATSSSSGYRNYLLCSTDGGVTWSMRPAINYTYSCSKCGVPGTPTTEAWPMTLVAIADDGALLATEDVPTGPFTVPGANNSQPTNTLFRLPLGGSAWQSLGAVPSTYGNVVYSGSPGQGVLWSIGEGTTTFTAAYP
jgi:hypothetical protein